MKGGIGPRLRGCIDTGEIGRCLDEAVEGTGASYSIVLPDDDSFSVLLGGPKVETGALGQEADEVLARLWEAEAQLTPVDANDSLAERGAPVQAVSPLHFRGTKYGLLLIHGENQDVVESEWWGEVVETLSDSLIKAQLYESAARESTSFGTKLDALNEAGGLVKHVDLELLLTKLMELSVRIMRAEVGAIVLYDKGKLTTGIEWGLREEVVLGLKTPDGRSFVEAVVQSGELCLIEDAPTSDRIDVDGIGVNLESLVVVPLTSHNESLGAILVANSEDGGLSAQDAEVLATIANMSATAVENAVLYEQTREHERISAEMNLAADIQKSLLPAEHPTTNSLETAGWCMSASETGGDFYDFIDMEDGRTGIVIGDATGHGMGAALIVFIARSTLKALLDGENDLETVVTRMNDLVEQDFDDDRFMTFYFGIYDEKTGMLRYTSAGHDPPLLYRPSTDEFSEHAATGTPLGILPGMSFPPEEIELKSGDFLIFGTDGIWEAQNPAGEFYGKERLKQIVRETHSLPMEEASEKIRRHILDFHEGAEQNDDITAILLRVK